MFIRVDIDPAVQADEGLCRQLVEMCPVDIFRASESGGGIETVDEHLDECTLCDLCVRASEGRIEVVKLYRL
jgi:NAD-dependent dihydropyrimidine dehydrogenase PreA subunit